MLRSLIIALPILFIVSVLLTMLTGCKTYSQTPEGVEALFAEQDHALDGHATDDHAHDEPRPYNAEADAKLEVEAMLSKVRSEGKLAIIAMGANWCHDSRGLASQFEKDRFKTGLLADHYALLYVDVGEKNRNIDIAQRFGEDEIVGTPTVFIVDGDGTVLNPRTAPTWRNAASRSEDEVYAYFEGFLDGEPETP